MYIVKLSNSNNVQMATMKSMIIVLLILILGITLFIVYENRESQKLVSNFISALLIGSLGLLISTIFSLKKEQIEDTFITFILFDKDNSSVIDLDWKLPLGERPNLEGKHYYQNTWSEVKKNNELSHKHSLFLTERRVLEAMHYINTPKWYSKKIKYDNIFLKGHSRVSTYTETKLKDCIPNRNTCLKLFHDNPFFIKDSSDIFNFSLPPNTSIKRDINSNVLTISLCNKFYKTSIVVEQLQTEQNIGKEFEKLVSHDFNDETLYLVTSFQVKIITTFSEMRMGNPKMKYYKEWSNRLSDYLKYRLGSERYQTNSIFID